MDKISVVIITLNEERIISRCLESVKEIADEIVVVDSFSTDKTIEICKSYGAKIDKHEFHSYIDQKNYALSQSSNNIVLSLDADEELSDELKKSILNLKSEGINFSAYSMNRLTRIGNKWINHSGWYPDTKIRLFDKTKGKWEGLNPHDEFVILNNNGVYKLKGNILHHSFYSFKELKTQTKRFAKLSAEAYFHKGKKAPIVKVVFNPFLRFIRDYIFNRGILHGKTGIKVCYNNAQSTYLKYKYLHDLYSKNPDLMEN